MPLHGDVIACCCNFVYHRECLVQAPYRCATCSEPRNDRGCLDLFGLSLNEDCRPGGELVVFKVDGELAKGTLGEGVEVAEGVAELCALDDEVQAQKQRVAELQQQLATAQRASERQRERLAEARRSTERLERREEQLAADLSKKQQEHQELCAQVEAVRQRDAVLNYWEELRNKTPQEALAFLTTMVSVVADPSKILTEVARLRDHHRKQLDQWQKACALDTRRETKARHELEDIRRAVEAHERRLARAPGAPGASARSPGPPAKRPRADDPRPGRGACDGQGPSQTS